MQAEALFKRLLFLPEFNPLTSSHRPLLYSVVLFIGVHEGEKEAERRAQPSAPSVMNEPGCRLRLRGDPQF